MSVSLQPQVGLIGSEQIEATTAPAIDPSSTGTNKLLMNGYNPASQSFDATTTPAADVAPVDLSKTLASADEDIDLTAAPLARDTGQTIDLTGKKLLALLMVAGGSNTGAITLKQAPTNGFPIIGDASGEITLRKSGQAVIVNADVTGLTAVGASIKSIRISGTVSDSVKIIAYFTGG